MENSRTCFGLGGLLVPYLIKTHFLKSFYIIFAMQEACLVNNLREVRVRDDGACFFRSISRALHGNEVKHLFYRKATVNYMNNRRPDFEGFITDGWETYLQDLAHPNSFVDHQGMPALSDMLSLQLCVHIPGKELCTIGVFSHSARVTKVYTFITCADTRAFSQTKHRFLSRRSKAGVYT